MPTSTIQILVQVAVDEPALAKVRQMRGIHVQIVSPEAGDRHLPAELLRDTQILFCLQPPEDFGQMVNVKWIQLWSVGYNQLFSLPLVERGIRATNARGCSDVPIAEWTVAMMINPARNLRQMIRNQEAAIWDVRAEYQQEVRGMTVGIWGYGGIGRETARLARQLGMRVHVLSRGGVKPIGAVYCLPGTGDPQGVLPNKVYLAGHEEAFLSELDFLILAVPLTRRTEGMIGECQLRWMRRSAFVLNPARGPLIQEQALLRALSEGWIAGVALDTHYKYPLPPEHSLWCFQKAILTPHISGSALNPHFCERTWDIFTQNIARLISGQPLLNELSAEQLRGE